MVSFANSNFGPSDLPPLLKVGEAAWMASISVRTLWRMVSARRFPDAEYMGRCARWRRSDVEGRIGYSCRPSQPDQQ